MLKFYITFFFYFWIGTTLTGKVYSKDNSSFYESHTDLAEKDTINLIHSHFASPNIRYENKNIISNFADYYQYFGKVFVSSENISNIITMTGLTIMLRQFDHGTYTLAHKEYRTNKVYKGLQDYTVNIGEGASQIGLSTIFGLYGITVKDYKAINTGSQILEGFVTTGLMVQLVKHVAGRERPTAMSKPSGRWDIFPNQKNYFKSITHYDSFCSGHFASAFTTYIILTENYPNSSAIKLIGIPALGALSVSLVSKGMHWPSDFPLSMLLGYTFGQVVAGSHLHPDNNISSNLIPILSLNQIGKKLGLNFVWKL